MYSIKFYCSTTSNIYIALTEIAIINGDWLDPTYILCKTAMGNSVFGVQFARCFVDRILTW